VTLDTPTTSPVYHTPIHLSVPISAVVAATDNATVLRQTWYMFGTRLIRTKHQKISFNGRPLTYYKEWGPAEANNTMELLLQQTDGQCAAFSSLFVNSLRVAGHNAAKFLVQLHSTVANEIMFISNWNIAGPGTSTVNLYPLQNTLSNPGVFPGESGVGSYIRSINGEWEYYWGNIVEVSDKIGAPGQNTDNPKSSFSDHTLVRIGGRYYDPSYGRDFDTLQLWEEGSVAAFATQGALPNFNSRLVFRTNPANNLEVYENLTFGPIN
jgi:hypothetical protein